MIMIYCYTLAGQESLIIVIIWAKLGVYNDSPAPQSHSPHHRSRASDLAGHWTSSFLSLHVYYPKSFCYNEDFLISSNLFSIVFETEFQDEAQLIQTCGDPPDPHLPGPGVPRVSQLLTS